MQITSLIAISMLGGVPAIQPEATVLDTVVICREEGRYIGWPTLLRRKDGELIAVFSGDRVWHVCPFGKVQAVRSRDDGRTWSSSETWVNGPLDDRDAGLVELEDGTLVLNWFTSTAFGGIGVPEWRKLSEGIPQATLRDELGFFTARSTDGGRTWTDRVRTEGTVPHGGVQLKDGRLLMATTHKGDAAKGEGWIQIEVSADGARSWTVLAKIPLADGTVHPPRFCEPHVTELPDGRLLTLVRDEREGHPVWQSESADGGRTWSPLRRSGFIGLPPFLTLLADGRVLCSYASRTPGDCGIRARVSADGGRTWDAVGEIRLAANLESDLGYPSTVQFPDGTLYTVYYMRDRMGEGTCLMATHWRLGKNAVDGTVRDAPKREFVLKDGTTRTGCRTVKPIPRQFDGRAVQVLEWDAFAPGSAAFVADPDAADGVAFLDPLREADFPFVLAIYSRDLVTNDERKLEKADIPDDGRYHLYRIGRGRIAGQVQVILNSSWRFGSELQDLPDGREREVWVSAKFANGRAYFDRLFLVTDRTAEKGW